MPQSHIISEELKELQSSLPGLVPQAGYQVPDGYFDHLPALIMERIKTESVSSATEELAILSPLLSPISKKNPYSLPEGYFGQLDPLEGIRDDISAEEEIEALSPLLAGIPRKNLFAVPEGYFKTLEIPVEKQEAPVIAMGPRHWFRYAAAAVVTGLIVLGSVIWYNNRSTGATADQQPYAWMEKNMKKVSTQEISSFVELTEGNRSEVAHTDVSADLKTLLKNVSDKEIQDFLNNTPSDDADDDIFFN